MSADKWCARTDLALETQESLKKANTDMRGVNFSEKKLDNGIIVSVVTIDSENAVRATGRPKGKYVTIEAAMLSEGDEECCQAVTRELSKELKSFVKAVCDKRIYAALVVGLGNRNVTADSLGPDVVDKLIINSHIHGEKDEISVRLSALSPGVMAQTGIETSSIIKGIADEIDPGVIIVIDALAARNTQRLNKTIQISNRGINPGSGVGNHRTGITSDNIGVPVIAVGVPTVIDAATIIGDVTKDYENIPKHLSDMYVTPKDIDENIRITAEIIAESINELVYA